MRSPRFHPSRVALPSLLPTSGRRTNWPAPHWLPDALSAGSEVRQLDIASRKIPSDRSTSARSPDCWHCFSASCAQSVGWPSRSRGPSVTGCSPRHRVIQEGESRGFRVRRCAARIAEPIILPARGFATSVRRRSARYSRLHHAPATAAVIRSTSAAMTARGERTTPCRSISARAR